MKIQVDAQALAAHRQIMERWKAEGVEIFKRRVRIVSFSVERGVKRRMPVDTGRARASWGHDTPPGQGEGIWEESNDGLTIKQGSRVEYIGELNEGHRQQAPAGFIDAEAKRGEEELIEGIVNDLVKAFR